MVKLVSGNIDVAVEKPVGDLAERRRRKVSVELERVQVDTQGTCWIIFLPMGRN